MTPLAIASLACLCIVTGGALGLAVGSRLPEHHLESGTKDAVRLAMAMIATMTALVLGLVTASAKSSYDAENAEVKHTAAVMLTLDRMLAEYGAETKPIRDSIRHLVASRMVQQWATEEPPPAPVTGATPPPREAILNAILALTPVGDTQAWYRSRALTLSAEILEARWIIYTGAHNTVPTVFLVVIVGWLTVLFASFGLFATRNATVIGALLVCSLSVAAAIFLILEMDDPFGGLMKISSTPMREALVELDR